MTSGGFLSYGAAAFCYDPATWRKTRKANAVQVGLTDGTMPTQIIQIPVD